MQARNKPPKQTKPREQDYGIICPKCKTHLELQMAFTIAALITETTIVKEE